ncbi:MAG: methyltransferase domain-containing protein [gamma proteobacterium symbiont of Taylorina sp.]|nr:methyltransferase domain-containing protein [gamma proteobacterium symbiont of Taylorina sp.]
MKQAFYTRDNCRLCGSTNLEVVIPLGLSPVSEKYTTTSNTSKQEIKVPLDLYFCHDCSHVQLIHIVEADFLWSDFTFKTANNPQLVKHFEDYANRVLAIIDIKENDLIVDVGSNDGTLLKCFQQLGKMNVLGVDPAQEIAAEAIANSITTKIDFMNHHTAEDIVLNYGKAKIVTANNVYAHADDLSEMTQAIKEILDQNGIFVFEVSYLLDVVDKMLIGTIFHEHLSYHSVSSLQMFLEKQGLHLFHVERGSEQGGSFIGYAQYKDGKQAERSSVKELLELEKKYGLNKVETLHYMFHRLEAVKADVLKLVTQIKQSAKSIAGFGAARAGTTLLSYFQIGQYMDYLIDDNVSKQGKFSPGDKLEVLPSSNIYEKKPDYLLILAWIHADNIIKQHQLFIDQGGRFVRLFPEIEVVGQE